MQNVVILNNWPVKGSVPDPWNFGTDPDHAIFITDLQEVHKNFLNAYLHHFSTKKSHKEVTKQQETMFFSLFLLDDRRIQIWIRIRIPD